MKFVIAAVIGLAVGLFGAAVYFTTARKPHLQARVSQRGGFPFLNLQEACSDQAVISTDEEKADYSLVTWWGDKGWHAFLRRADGAVWTLEESRDASKVLRQMCRVVAEDFPLWLSTKRYRPAVVPVTPPDATGRYELKDYRNGPIVGLALVDTEDGRVWLLANSVDAKGKTTGTVFHDVGVEGLWETTDELLHLESTAPDEILRKDYLGELGELEDLKKLTRPREMQEAEKASERKSN